MALAIWSYPNQRTFRAVKATPKKLRSFNKLGNQHAFVIAPYELENDFYAIPIKQVRVLEKAHTLLESAQLFQNEIGHRSVLPSYEQQVALAVAELGFEGALEKVVLSRYADEGFGGFNPFWLDHLRKAYPEAFICLVSDDQFGTWLTASPELFLKRRGDFISSFSLAGTKYSSETDLGEKERHEQYIVTDYIRNVFTRNGFDVQVNKNMEQKAGHLTHLLNVVEGMLGAGKLDLDHFIRELHPTPAVGGKPKAWAREFIGFEGYNRELYTGFLGEYQGSGNFELYVNLRCAQVHVDSIRLYAGAGITVNSIPEKERLETEAKMGILKSVLLSQQ